jgi:hypothetical protein
MKRVAVGRKRLVRIWRVHHSNWSVRPGNELVRLRWLATPSPLKEEVEETAAEDERFQEVIILIGELTFYFFFFKKKNEKNPSFFYLFLVSLNEEGLSTFADKGEHYKPRANFEYLHKFVSAAASSFCFISFPFRISMNRHKLLHNSFE